MKKTVLALAAFGVVSGCAGSGPTQDAWSVVDVSSTSRAFANTYLERTGTTLADAYEAEARRCVLPLLPAGTELSVGLGTGANYLFEGVFFTKREGETVIEMEDQLYVMRARLSSDASVVTERGQAGVAGVNAAAALTKQVADVIANRHLEAFSAC